MPALFHFPPSRVLARSQDTDERTDKHSYQSKLGSLMYLAISIRFDLAPVVSQLSRYASDPSVQHMQALDRVFLYLAGTVNLSLHLGGHVALVGWSDASFSDDKDTGRSTHGYVYKFGNGFISWTSRLQSLVALSTTEAEILAVNEAIKEALYIRELMVHFGLDNGPTLLYTDNIGALELSKNPRPHGRTKHINAKLQHLRDAVDDDLVRIQYTRTNTQLADALTKPVGISTFQEYLSSGGLSLASFA